MQGGEWRRRRKASRVTGQVTMVAASTVRETSVKRGICVNCFEKRELFSLVFRLYVSNSSTLPSIPFANEPQGKIAECRGAPPCKSAHSLLCLVRWSCVVCQPNCFGLCTVVGPMDGKVRSLVTSFLNTPNKITLTKTI